MPLRWNGAEIEAKALAAAKRGVDATMGEAVREAKNRHPWRNRTGTLEGSVRIVQTAHADGLVVKGRWGSADVKYAIFLELGTSKMPAYPFLRPAADREYPHLRRRIAAAYAGESLL